MEIGSGGTENKISRNCSRRSNGLASDFRKMIRFKNRLVFQNYRNSYQEVLMLGIGLALFQ